MASWFELDVQLLESVVDVGGEVEIKLLEVASIIMEFLCLIVCSYNSFITCEEMPRIGTNFSHPNGCNI